MTADEKEALHRQALRLLAITQREMENDTTDFDRAFDYADRALNAIAALRILDAAATRKKEESNGS